MMIKNENLLKIFAGGDFFSKFPIQVTVEILPDPTITVADMIDYGYFHSDVLPLGYRNAMILSDAEFPILELFEDNTERNFDSEDFSEYNIHNKVGGIWGIRKGVWYSYLEDEPDYALLEDLWLSERAEVLDPEQFPDALAPIAPEFPAPPEPPFLDLNEMEDEAGAWHFGDEGDPFDL